MGLAALLLTAAAPAGAVHGAKPTTLVGVSGPIVGFTQSERYLAWATEEPGPCETLCESVTWLRERRPASMG